MRIEDTISMICRKIIEDIKPHKIILFGSHAEGTADPNSDIDLLVIWDGNGLKSNRERRLAIRHVLHSCTDIGMDILTYTEEEIKRITLDSGTFVSQILKEGKVLYEKCNCLKTL